MLDPRIDGGRKMLFVGGRLIERSADLPAQRRLSGSGSGGALLSPRRRNIDRRFTLW